MTDPNLRLRTADHSLANPRRTTLVGLAERDTAAPAGETASFTALGDDAANCADGVCSIPE